MKTVLIIFVISYLCIAQNEDPLNYFPHKTGDMWEYFWADLQYPDTLQNFNIKDSIDSEGNIYLTQSARFINPIMPPALLSDTSIYKIDTSYNVFCLTCPKENQFLYKLNAQQGDQWVVWNYHGGGYEMARVKNTWEDELFIGSGTYTKFKAFVYYYASDSTDTLGLARYGTVLARNFGLWSKGGGDAVGEIYLKGCVINRTLYGDTTNIITSLKDRIVNHSFQLELFPNFPNPFNPLTTIVFMLNNPNNISVIIYDIMGREVRRLIDNKFYPSGEYRITWNARSDSNEFLPSGQYFYRIIYNGSSISRSMILLK